MYIPYGDTVLGTRSVPLCSLLCVMVEWVSRE